MRHWLEMGYTNTLFFEHTYYIDIDILEYILTKNNFVIDKIIAGNHSIFVKSVKVDNTTTSNAYFEKPKQIFGKYIEGLEEDILSINSKLSDDDNVFLFGAHIFSQTLLSLGIKSKVLSILDNDKKKQDKRLYGTDLIVKDPKVLYNYTEPKVIIRAGVYSEEIKAQLLASIQQRSFMKKILVCFVGTGTYLEFLPQYYEKVMENFCPGYPKDILVLTDGELSDTPEHIILRETEHKAWPFTLLLKDLTSF